MSSTTPVEVDVRVHGAVLDDAGPWRRSMPRPVAQRQRDYEERFDASTLLYDAFRVGDDVEMIGPPLLDLAAGLRPLDLRGGGRRFARRLTTEAKDRLQRYRVVGVPAGVRSLRLTCPLGSFRIPIGDDASAGYAGRRVLVTQSRDNPLSWIAAWVDHHVRTQGIDAVVLYDNGSTAYTADDVREVMRRRSGIAVFTVVEWPYPWGPTGGPDAVWDSDYGQHGSWEHASRRLCRTASTITFGDVDELIVCTPPTVTERALARPSGVCSYARRPILSLPERPRGSDAPRRYADYCRYDADAPLLSPKYTVVPRALGAHTQLMVHRVDGIAAPAERDVLARHFDGMRIEWREGAREPVPELPPSPTRDRGLSIDQELRRALAADTETP